ncbi:MAG: D-alanine--D-alanine ligase [Puniceicoccales bacterium]|nr:D-alanine--D-alanine ligase [Puniceicoccales bacterium]
MSTRESESVEIIVLCGGGSSSEREISLRSGKNVYRMCQQSFPTQMVILNEDALPAEVAHAKDSIVFPVTLGEFGEDGGLQTLLESAGLTFVGSDAKASALCMNKFAAKQVLSANGVRVPDGIKFTKQNMPTTTSLIETLGSDLFLKPNAKGSSLGASVISSKEELVSALSEIGDGEYVVERMIHGIDLTVAVLDGVALEVVEILPKHGFLDYDNKYVPGKSDRICPAKIPPNVAKEAKAVAESAFQNMGCRDWARMDFVMEKSGKLFFLETNTIPGMTDSSFFPISAAAVGIDLPTLVAKLVRMAASRRR